MNLIIFNLLKRFGIAVNTPARWAESSEFNPPACAEFIFCPARASPGLPFVLRRAGYSVGLWERNGRSRVSFAARDTGARRAVARSRRNGNEDTLAKPEYYDGRLYLAVILPYTCRMQWAIDRLFFIEQPSMVEPCDKLVFVLLNPTWHATCDVNRWRWWGITFRLFSLRLT